MDEKLHVIAEAGSNYNGDPRLACDLVDVAAAACADSVKFQIINTEGLYRKGVYKYGHYDIADIWKIREDNVLTDEEWKKIASHATSKGIKFTSSVFDTQGLDLVCSFNPEYIKMASCDLNNYRLLREVGERGYPMVVSTGMSTMPEIEKAVIELAKVGIEGSKLILLHCVSVYPAPITETNLRFIEVLKHEFGTSVGFSDHTTSSVAACAAVALGATWLEKHFTTSNLLDGLDHKHAAEPEIFKQYVSDTKSIHEALRTATKKIGDGEAYTKERARRGIYAACNLPVGHILTAEDLLVVRPESEISAGEADNLVGRIVEAVIGENEPISLQHLKEK